MSSDYGPESTWSRRDVFRLGGLATAAAAAGGLAMPDAAAAAANPGTGPQVYTRIGVRPFINLTGTLTINPAEGEVDLGEYGKARWMARRQA